MFHQCLSLSFSFWCLVFLYLHLSSFTIHFPLSFFIYLFTCPFLSVSLFSFCCTCLSRNDFLSSSSVSLSTKVKTVAKTKEVERELSMSLGAGERRKYTRAWHLVLLLFAGVHQAVTKEPHVVRVARGSRDKFPVVPTRVLRCASACRPRYSIPKGNRVAALNRSFISAIRIIYHGDAPVQIPLRIRMIA